MGRGTITIGEARHIAKKYSLDVTSRPRLDGFAEACYDDNSIDELTEALDLRAADKTDCENWDIKPREWRLSIRLALSARCYEALEE